MKVPEDVLHRLMGVIEDRHRNRPEGSYTTQLFAGGVERIGAKVMEEAGELVEAAATAKPAVDAVVHEAADLIYHLLVLLAQAEVTLEAVEAELARRFGISGLEEKARRQVY